MTHLSEFFRVIETHEVAFSELAAPGYRLDAAHYRREYSDAIKRIAGGNLNTRKLSTIADAFVPGRIRLKLVNHKHDQSAPYLKAHGAFDIRPKPSRYVPKRSTPHYDSMLLKAGTILTPSSGRNLGPLAYVGEYLAGFAMTDIMRIVPFDLDTGFYLLAYLLTDVAQSIIRRGRTGTTVDHLSPGDVLALDIPWFDESIRNSFSSAMQQAESLLNHGRKELDDIAAELHASIGLPPHLPSVSYISRSCGDAFSSNVRDIGLRLDAASHDPSTLECRRLISGLGGIALREAATLKTLARYKRYYVDPPNGRPVLSGRQMLQLRPVNLKRISDRSFDNPLEFIVKAGDTIFTCDGRSEDALGTPAYIMPAWDGWMASEHVMRATAKRMLGDGFLYIALSSPWVQQQLKARATGSVIDALEPEEIGSVMLPFPPKEVRESIDARVVRSWRMISESISLTQAITARFEGLLHA